MQRTDAKRNPQCPRCGYDQRGVMGLWEDSCPLMGKCSECGLDYEWSIVTQPEKYEPQWCVEFSHGWKSVLKSSFKTYCCSFVPWWFWSRVKMSYSVRWRRLAAYICILVLPFIMSYVVAQGTAAVIVRYRMQQWIDGYMQGVPQQIARLQSIAKNIPAEYLEGVPDDQIAARKNQIVTSINPRINMLKQMQKTPPTISLSYVDVVIEAVFYPFAQTSSGTVGPGFLSGTYPPPNQLYSELFDRPSSSLRRIYSGRTGFSLQWSSIRDVAMPVLISLIVGIVGFLLFPVAMVVLPASRNKAKVKWSHIIRVASYSICIPQILLMIFILLTILAFTISKVEPIASNLLVLVDGIGIWLGLIVWWSVAIKRYLKMNHGLAVAVLLSVLVIVALATLGAVLTGAYDTEFWL